MACAESHKHCLLALLLLGDLATTKPPKRQVDLVLHSHNEVTMLYAAMHHAHGV